MGDNCRNPDDELNTNVADKDSVVDVCSPAQITLSLTMLMLITRGSLNVNEKVSRYWPEHIARGGNNVEVRHLLSCNSGVFGCDKLVTIKDISELVRRTDGRSLELFVAEELTGCLRSGFCQQWTGEQEQDGRHRTRLQPLTNSSAVVHARSGHISKVASRTSRK